MNAHRFLAILVLLMALLGAGVNPVRAEGETPKNDETCESCHASLYMLYDTGKYHCLCQAKASCTDCHGGVVGAVEKEIAHQGLIANPLSENSAICQQCHPQDAEMYVERFKQIAGVHPATIPVPTYECLQEGGVSTVLDDLLRPTPIEPWRLVSLGVVILAFFGMLVFAVQCCREDRSHGMKGTE